MYDFSSKCFVAARIILGTKILCGVSFLAYLDSKGK